MELQLKNVGMIKEANVKIDGLTVIAGENDTGKSTVGKALFFLYEFSDLFLIEDVSYRDRIKKDKKNIEKKLKSLENELEKFNKHINDLDKEDIELENFSDFNKTISLMENTINKSTVLLKQIEQLSKIKNIYDELEKKSDIELEKFFNQRKLDILEKKYKDFFSFDLTNITNIFLKNMIGINNKKFITKESFIEKIPIFIETPIISNLFRFFSKIDTVKSEIKYKIDDYPYLFKSLYKQLKLPLKGDIEDFNYLINNISKIIYGELKINNSDNLVFERGGKEFNILAVATGIKSFSILQLLAKNGYLNKDSILIFDEPEVHLHPKWQLEMAKIIVELVKNGVKILVTSHSPYMIEALKRYSELEGQEDKTNFYLAEGGYIKQINNSNSETLVEIFEKLSEPFDTFEKMDENSLGKLING